MQYPHTDREQEENLVLLTRLLMPGMLSKALRAGQGILHQITCTGHIHKV